MITEIFKTVHQQSFPSQKFVYTNALSVFPPTYISSYHQAVHTNTYILIVYAYIHP